VNLAGLPAINVPARRTSDGLPVGATLVGGEGGEQTIARIAMRWESVSGYAPAYPQLPNATG
jgi:Asp-tRNA(Asn)/Glu-tRNA(Gln) amidotransferase A subunit family amidase